MHFKCCTRPLPVCAILTDVVVVFVLFAAVLEVRLRPWVVTCLVCLLITALGVGIGIPLALSGASPPPLAPTTLEQRLDAVRRILSQVPLIDGCVWYVYNFLNNPYTVSTLILSILINIYVNKLFSHSLVTKCRLRC